jgi:hypothetical protein
LKEYRLVGAFALLIASLCVYGASSYTEGAWQLVTPTSSIDASTYSDCLAKWRAQPEPARQRTDYCRQRLVTKRLADLPPPPPPAPIDCQVSDWSTPTLGDWSACVNSVQTRSSSRSRTVVTAAANGGKACPALTDSTVESRSCSVDPPPPVDPPAGDVVYASPPSADMSKLAPGATMLLRDGTYTSINYKGGTAAAWTTLRAEHDGAALVPALSIGAGNWFLVVDGVKAAGSGSAVTGSFVKLKRVAFKGGPSSGNGVSLQIGTNDRTPGASNILVEDSWVYGAGGRYKLLVYNADKVVIRRAVVRHDGGWTPSKGDPQGGITIYDSANVRVENSLCVDSVQGLPSFESCFYLVSNGTTATRVANVAVMGSIVIDSPNNGIAAEGSASATWSVIDAAVLRSAAGGFNTNGSGNLVVTRGFADVKGAPFAAWNGSLKASGCIFKGGANSGASLTSCSSTLPGAITQPNELGQGANIAFRIGVDGTLFDEPGFEDLTTVPLWPWPNEERIKADFDAVRPAFGGRSLTGYVQGATP